MTSAVCTVVKVNVCVSVCLYGHVFLHHEDVGEDTKAPGCHG